MNFKKLSSKVLLYVSRLLGADADEVNVSSFDRRAFNAKTPAPEKALDATVDTTNWFAYDRSGLIRSTTYLLGRMEDEYFSNKILNNTDVMAIQAGILCLNAGSSNNYYHWVIQTVLSIIGYQEVLDASLPFLFRNQLSRYQQEWLDIIKFDKKRMLSLRNATTLHLENLYILPTLYKPFDFKPCVTLIDTIRNLIFSNLYLEKEYEGSFSKIYISRSDSRKPRGIYSETKLESFLRDHGYVTVRMADYSVTKQISMIASAESIIAPHGAGLTNIIFAKPTCNILEINNHNYVNTCFSRIWEAMTHSTSVYKHLVCKGYQGTNVVDDGRSSYHHSKCIVDFDELLMIV